MRCMACGAEMILTNVVEDNTMAVPGFEHRTFVCSECQDVEQRLVFAKQACERDTELMAEQAAPPIVPAPTVQDEDVTASGLLSHKDTRPVEQHSALRRRSANFASYEYAGRDRGFALRAPNDGLVPFAAQACPIPPRPRTMMRALSTA